MYSFESETIYHGEVVKPSIKELPRDKDKVKEYLNDQRGVTFKPKKSVVPVVGGLDDCHSTKQLNFKGFPITKENSKTPQRITLLLPKNATATHKSQGTSGGPTKVSFDPTQRKGMLKNLNSETLQEDG